MKLLKNAVKTYYAFVFPSDEGIDWDASARAVIEKLPAVKEDFSANLKELGINIPDEQLADVYAKRVNKEVVYKLYTDSDFNPEVIQGKEKVTLLFDSITELDLDSILSAFPKVEKLLTKKNLSKEFLKDKHTLSQLKEFVLKVMELKLQDLEYDESIPKENRFSKQDLIEHLKNNGMALEDFTAFQNFFFKLIKGSVKKKMSSKSFAE